MTELERAVQAALATVQDPEIRRPITDLGMVPSITEDQSGERPGHITVSILLTIVGCPLSTTIERDVTNAVSAVPGVTGVDVEVGVMSPEQRAELISSLKRRTIPFADPQSLTRVIGVASGKGGVGKSTVTVNLATALAAQGLKVGVVDADVYGFSVPALMGLGQAKPTRVGELIMPPVAFGVKVISIGMFLDEARPIMWRGPMLHRALEQFLTDVHFGDLDFLLLDLPPGTGDIAISASQLLPGSELLVVTTPQSAAADVAQRAGEVTSQTGQKVIGVVENMSWMELPDGSRVSPFGEGGGQKVADALNVELLGSIPLESALRAGGDEGTPVVIGDPGSPAAQALMAISQKIAVAPRGLSGRRLGVQPL
ncbi:Mrp/NBP35 family ATP-binding protein [Neomicrococcus lactis]|uniref:Iron-sulfur cluster carrier protein n=1 Tax=Neomicrococcus lactis TaxID=732241 RepID=A0A7W9DAV0_9MICC|nr:ATP-binding protein involved in chromosome partitioning [Neomicrococcus lactis]